MMKKGQGLSMNVIIIAALALLVLVILSVIFMSRTGVFVRESKSCVQNGGQCVDISDDCPPGMAVSVLSTIKCTDSSGNVQEDSKCCMAGE